MSLCRVVLLCIVCIHQGELTGIHSYIMQSWLYYCYIIVWSFGRDYWRMFKKKIKCLSVRNKESEQILLRWKPGVSLFCETTKHFLSHVRAFTQINGSVFIFAVRGREEFITGYSGQSVVLKSGADRSWNLTRVQWSIYKNTTYIASLKDGEVIIYNFWRHQGRLDLNKETGDLTIRNVTMDDSMTYNVALVTSDDTRKQDKVHLTVRGKQSWV